VNQEDITRVAIHASCANGTPMPLEEARVKLSVRDMKLTCRVGVAPSRLIGGTGLLSFDLNNEEKWQQLTVLRKCKAEEDPPTEEKGGVLGSVLVSEESKVLVNRQSEEEVVSPKLNMYAEEWRHGFDLLFQESSSEARNDSVAGNSRVGESGDNKPVPVVKKEEYVPMNMVMEDSLVLEPLKKSEDVKALKNKVKSDESLRELKE